MERQSILKRAIEAVSNRGEYGPPEQNFERIASLWRAFLSNKWEREVYLDAVDVALMMALLKIARLQATPDHVDSAVDLAGYAACAAEVADLQAALEPTWTHNVNTHGEELT